jgi:hypothetical protein
MRGTFAQSYLHPQSFVDRGYRGMEIAGLQIWKSDQ